MGGCPFTKELRPYPYTRWPFCVTDLQYIFSASPSAAFTRSWAVGSTLSSAPRASSISPGRSSSCSEHDGRHAGDLPATPLAIIGAVTIVTLVGGFVELLIFPTPPAASVLTMIIITIGLSIVIREARTSHLG